MAEKENLKDKGIVFFTRAFDFRNYIADDAISNTFEDKIVLDFFVDRSALPAKAIYDLDENDEFIEPGKFSTYGKIAIERNLQFSVTFTLKNALKLKQTIEEAIEELVNTEES